MQKKVGYLNIREKYRSLNAFPDEKAGDIRIVGTDAPLKRVRCPG